MSRRTRFPPPRLFHVLGSGWFVQTREGVRGPFVRRELAEIHLRALRRVCCPRARLFADG
ncbi:hypothetical protein [Inmirania thermothiophila]|uniref:Uncharacterized protein n=1 Tax=Inmirania thermothiophila TaxID=1750597 RepID=A0A3N1Y835_9GAMM|nr:hypothetical protein [Inmirania thermothiophila]ROR34979.1 hypothetical protein EDC57_0894 [Inmirania thermothiophila]